MCLFGKSEAAIKLEEMVSDDPYLRAKVVSHISEYNNYVDNVLTMPSPKAQVKALEAGLDCDLHVPDKIKNYIRNVKKAKYRNALKKCLTR